MRIGTTHLCDVMCPWLPVSAVGLGHSSHRKAGGQGEYKAYYTLFTSLSFCFSQSAAYHLELKSSQYFELYILSQEGFMTLGQFTFYSPAIKRTESRTWQPLTTTFVTLNHDWDEVSLRRRYLILGLVDMGKKSYHHNFSWISCQNNIFCQA